MVQVDRTAPIDEAHQISMELMRLIGDAFDRAHRRIQEWSPSGCPPRRQHGRVNSTQTKTEKL